MAERYANSYHGRKNKFLGPQAVPPAWKNDAKTRVVGGQSAPKSKILLSFLPPDVSPEEVHVRLVYLVMHVQGGSHSSVAPAVQNLFAKTVGPVQDSFIVYNSQGNSKGMAVVAFHKPESAALARQKYNGKIIDGSKYALHVCRFSRYGSFMRSDSVQSQDVPLRLR